MKTSTVCIVLFFVAGIFQGQVHAQTLKQNESGGRVIHGVYCGDQITAIFNSLCSVRRRKRKCYLPLDRKDVASGLGKTQQPMQWFSLHPQKDWVFFLFDFCFFLTSKAYFGHKKRVSAKRAIT